MVDQKDAFSSLKVRAWQYLSNWPGAELQAALCNGALVHTAARQSCNAGHNLSRCRLNAAHINACPAPAPANPCCPCR